MPFALLTSNFAGRQKVPQVQTHGRHDSRNRPAGGEERHPIPRRLCGKAPGGVGGCHEQHGRRPQGQVQRKVCQEEGGQDGLRGGL